MSDVPCTAAPEPCDDPIRLATAPFNNDARSALIIWPSLLRAASPDELLYGLLVRTAEDTATLDLLLRWCYTICAPMHCTSLQRTWRPSNAMQNYNIDEFERTPSTALASWPSR
ncbi:hypothetical protein FA95DRAFT_1612193 [Auriscalpium vulgare]|uniref:Uncharacterized protein n=1 Tax=Auriscalpium vulgare TaxID=40419 RepID=A0ACB8R781_9AGAM|nr:hypothetical protein FA95DRAFT_1612193 [Auriscalpium vulgare]